MMLLLISISVVIMESNEVESLVIIEALCTFRMHQMQPLMIQGGSTSHKTKGQFNQCA